MSLSEPIRHDPAVRTYRDWWELEMRRRSLRMKRLVTISDVEVRRRALEADYWACRQDPVYWIEQYGWVHAPKAPREEEQIVPFVLWDLQKALVRTLMRSISEDPPAGIDDSFPVVILKAREQGISWLCCSLVYWLWRFSARSSKLLSRKEEFVDDRGLDSLFGKLRYIHGRQMPHLRERDVVDKWKMLLNSRNGAEIVGEATNESAGRGGRKSIILFDEFAFVQPRIAAAAYTSCDTVAKAIWMPSTPNGRGNKFFDLYEKLPRECIVEIPWSANPYKDQKWAEMKRLTLTQDEFDQEHGLSFTAVRSGRIWSLVRDAIEYDEKSPDWAEKAEAARRTWYHVGGWDFGSGPSATVCLFAVLEYVGDDPIPVIWVDDERIWTRTRASEVAADATLKMQSYSQHHRIHYGDPAGKSRHAEQLSWLDLLLAGGVPLVLAPDNFNTKEGITWMIEHVQWLLDSAKLRVHKRCVRTLDAIESWAWDVPDGVDMEHLSKDMIQPKKDMRSHPANSLMYLVAGVASHFTEQRGEKARSAAAKRRRMLPLSSAGSFSQIVALSRNV